MNASWMIGAWIVFAWESVKSPAANSFVSKSLEWMICQLVIAAYRQEIDAKIFLPLNVYIGVCVCRCKFLMTAKNAVPSPKKQPHEWKRPFGFPFSFHVVIANKTAGIAAVVSKWKNSSNSSGHEGLKCWEKFLPHFYFHYCTSHKILAYRLSFVKLCHEIVNISTCFHCVFTE